MAQGSVWGALFSLRYINCSKFMEYETENIQKVLNTAIPQLVHHRDLYEGQSSS